MIQSLIIDFIASLHPRASRESPAHPLFGFSVVLFLTLRKTKCCGIGDHELPVSIEPHHG
jgi:hypothetical protein